MSSGRAARALLLAALTVAAALLVLLARDHRDLARQYADLRKRTVSPHPGIFVPTFRAPSLDGDTLSVGNPASGRNQVLLFFTTRCPYSRASINRWRALHQAVRTDFESASVIGVALDSLEAVRAYAERHHLPYPVVTLPERKLAALYRVRRVPLLVVIGEGGRILHARMGAMESQPAVDSVLQIVRERPAPTAHVTRSSAQEDGSQTRSTPVSGVTDEP